MNSSAQASLDYLLTFGWAIILVVTAIGIIFFVTTMSTHEAIVSINQSDEIILKSSSVGNILQAVLQNVTSGQIKIMDIIATEALENCTIKIGGNEAGLINSGQIMLLECNYSEKEPGSVSILYKNFAGFDKTATINVVWPNV